MRSARSRQPGAGSTVALLLLTFMGAVGIQAQDGRTPDRGPNEGEGPFDRLIIRGALVIDGSGAPPSGPTDIVIEGNRIVEVRAVGYPGVPIDPSRRPGGATREIDAHGQFVLPGFIDLHVHAGGPSQKVPNPTYSYKLWLAHGVTTVRGVALGEGDLVWALEEKARSARNEIVAPRIYNCAKNPDRVAGWDDPDLMDPESARRWVRFVHDMGADCLKLGRYAAGMMDPPVMEAILDEARTLGLGSTAHLHQPGVARMNALDMARLGLVGTTHFYGLFESMYRENRVQPFPMGYNYQDEQHRFGQVGPQWRLIHEQGSDGWNALLDEFLERDFFLNPTLTIYEASRDVMRNRNADWMHEFALPSMLDFYQPGREAHGSYWFYWTTKDEVEWRNFYQRWMAFLNDYKNRGGKVTTGSDSGFIYNLYGFGYIRELELLQEAGFHPLEVIQAATLHASEELFHASGESPPFGLIRPGLLADLVIVEEDPLANFKILYGTGAVRLNDDTGDVERVSSIRYTIKDGIVYDSKQLLQDVRDMVEAQRMERLAAGGDR
ncbi:MAG: amidohydrolase family protein [Gemmatimonadota bacterium]